MKITDEIFQVGGGTLTSPEDAAVYLLDFDGHAALIDAGCGRSQERLLGKIAACRVEPKRIELLLITHCHFDHTGGAASLRELLGCKTVAHELEAAFLEEGDNQVTAATWYDATLRPFPVDVKLSGAQVDLMLGKRSVTAIHMPGHSPGSVVYLTESEGRRILFGQDVHGPLDASLKSNRADYVRSLERMLDLEADVLCEGHYGVYQGRDEVARFIGSFL